MGYSNFAWIVYRLYCCYLRRFVDFVDGDQVKKMREFMEVFKREFMPVFRLYSKGNPPITAAKIAYGIVFKQLPF